MMRRVETMAALAMVLSLSHAGWAQSYGQPDRGQPGDEAIQQYLAEKAVRLDAQFAEDLISREARETQRAQYLEEYYYMLGLWPWPERTPLNATITGRLEGDGYVVENLHYQSKPRLYVTANLYRPPISDPGTKYPAVLYVCGHSGRGRDGNKTAFQSHGIWLARHGFACLIVDTLQLGEIAAKHHGTYNLERWWWHSRGYTPAGVECWNGVRGIDYLVSRDDVDPDRIGVTGISGGGAATFWIAAADERVKVAIPISGMADLESYVANRVINGHCDCMFLYNTFQWPWTRIAGLVAPRPMLFINSDNDPIFPMDANQRISNRLERLYSLYGASDRFDTVVSVGGHAYREDIRRATFAFLQYHLQQKADPITDSEVDLVDETTKPPRHPIPPERLRAFPTDADIPADELNSTIDEHFVPMAKPELPKVGEYEAWKKDLLTELRRVVFRTAPSGELRVSSDDVLKEPWTRKNPPNYVERSHALLGETVDTHRVRSYIAAQLLAAGTASKEKAGGVRRIRAEGSGPEGIIRAYAAVLRDDLFEGVTLIDPPATHMAAEAPQFLNILRVCDVPEMLGLIAPRPLKIITNRPENFERTKAIYRAAGAERAISISAP